MSSNYSSWIFLEWKQTGLTSSELHTGANVNSVKFHETALHHAARVSMVDMIELLVEFGANVYASDNLGRKPVDYTTPASPPHTCLIFYESEFMHCLRGLLAISSFAFESIYIYIYIYKKTLLFSAGNPLSLQQLCRITVRTMLGTRASEVIGQLDISHRIYNYLQCCDHLTSLEWYMNGLLCERLLFDIKCNISQKKQHWHHDCLGLRLSTIFLEFMSWNSGSEPLLLFK